MGFRPDEVCVCQSHFVQAFKLFEAKREQLLRFWLAYRPCGWWDVEPLAVTAKRKGSYNGMSGITLKSDRIRPTDLASECLR